jgi:hypothetical protein
MTLGRMTLTERTHIKMTVDFRFNGSTYLKIIKKQVLNQNKNEKEMEQQKFFKKFRIFSAKFLMDKVSGAEGFTFACAYRSLIRQHIVLKFVPYQKL